MPYARLALDTNLQPLLSLFAMADVSEAAQPWDHAVSIWREILVQAGAFVFVSEADGQIAAACMLITTPNLLRSGRRHGFLENVVTHPEQQGRGHGKAVVCAALTKAWGMDCHHV